MTPLSPVFLWLLPLALLPVIIHLLNRLRYQTVHWAAMQFLRSADRDASRRARIRQWLILAARCAMLLMLVLALARCRSEGRVAGFFRGESPLVVVVFDRSTRLEQTRGGMSGRERGIRLVEEGLSTLPANARVLWLDSATGNLFPLPNRSGLARLPFLEPSNTQSDMISLLWRALDGAVRSELPSAEIWLVTDRQTAAWMPEGVSVQDWSEWADADISLQLRLLDVSRVEADPGNRSLQLAGDPVRDGEDLRVPLRLIRDHSDSERIPLLIEREGLALREDLRVEGREFVWEQVLEGLADSSEPHARLSLPSDSLELDNDVSVSWVDPGTVRVTVDVDSPALAAVVRAGLLPEPGARELVPGAWTDQLDVWIRTADRDLREDEEAWVADGGIVLELPAQNDLQPLEEEDGLVVESWQRHAGVLRTEGQEPLRLDQVRVFQASALSLPDPDTRVLARLETERPLLQRTALGQGAVYRLSTLPLREISTLDAGFVWVPVLQRLLQEGAQRPERGGTFFLSEWAGRADDRWIPLDGEERRVGLRSGRYEREGQVVALNRNPAGDMRDTLSVDELEEWAHPLPLAVFEDRSAAAADPGHRLEWTILFAWLALAFLAVESWLLSQNVRRPEKVSAWRRQRA